MKYLLALLLSGNISALFAQWQPINSSATDNGNIYHLNGNVGIGTSTINGNLQIGSGTGGGLVNLGGYAFAGCIRSSGDYFAGSNVLAQYGSSSENGTLRVAATSNGFSAMHLASNGDVNFFTKSGSVNANDPITVAQSTYNSMKITGGGNVGIGTTSVTEKLVVQGNIQVPLSNSIGYVPSVDNFTHNGNTIGNYSLGWANDSWTTSPTAYLSGYGGLKIFTGATPRMVVDRNGNVGIGTTTPGGKLHVEGSAYVGNENGDGLYRVSIGASGGDYGSIGYGYKYGLTSSSYTYALADYASQLRFENGGFSFFTAPSGSAGSAVGFSRVMTVLQNGNIGIGSSSPDAKLAVKGQIHASEVKVDLNVPGPDYVFEKDYQLTSLEDIKIYIDENKHLPEVPSAKEMEKNGVQLGEMNMILLKKIEELTLYVLELKKENDAQNQAIKELINKSN